MVALAAVCALLLVLWLLALRRTGRGMGRALCKQEAVYHLKRRTEVTGDASYARSARYLDIVL